MSNTTVNGATINLDSVFKGHANVIVDGTYVGTVIREEVGYQVRPGWYSSRDEWFALTPGHAGDAFPAQSGCPSFDTRAEAVAHLTRGY